MRTVSAFILLVTVGVSTAAADLVNSSFNKPIVQQSSWAAGIDATGVWYGPGYVADGGYASLADVQQGNRTVDMNDARRGLFQAVKLTDVGDFTWSLDCMLTEYDTQYCYWQAYLMKEGATIDLIGGPGYNQGVQKSKTLQSTVNYAPANKDGGTWYTYEQHFTITEKDVKNYDYIGFVLVGSRRGNEMLGFDNVRTTYGGATAACTPEVPEPATLALVALGLGALVIRRKHHA